MYFHIYFSYPTSTSLVYVISPFLYYVLFPYVPYFLSFFLIPYLFSNISLRPEISPKKVSREREGPVVGYLLLPGPFFLLIFSLCLVICSLHFVDPFFSPCCCPSVYLPVIISLLVITSSFPRLISAILLFSLISGESNDNRRKS